MSFFDRKQDVLDLQLTAYGKRMLAQGQLVPHSYSFSDEAVIYDNGSTENQNDVHDRIVNTPRTKTQHRFVGLESGSIADNIPQVTSFEREYVNGLPLGTSKFDDSLPSWDIRFLQGELSYSLSALTGTLGLIAIPQLYMKDLEIITEVKKSDSVALATSFGDSEDECLSLDDNSPIFDDGTFFDTYFKPIMMEIKENNSILGKNDFKIELFEEKESNLEILWFETEPERIVNGILLDDNEISPIFTEDLRPTDVEYFFDIEIDEDTEKLTTESNRFIPDLYDFPKDEFEEC